MNYQAIKKISKESGCSVKYLIVLSPQNDPFYVGTKSKIALAEWFAELWELFGYTAGIHLRRIHYQIVSQDPPVIMPNGKPYKNTENCWSALVSASGYARYLHFVDPAAFDDRRNGKLLQTRWKRICRILMIIHYRNPTKPKRSETVFITVRETILSNYRSTRNFREKNENYN